MEKEVRVAAAELETQTQVALALSALTHSPQHQTLQTERHHQPPPARAEPTPHLS